MRKRIAFIASSTAIAAGLGVGALSTAAGAATDSTAPGSQPVLTDYTDATALQMIAQNIAEYNDATFWQALADDPGFLQWIEAGGPSQAPAPATTASAASGGSAPSGILSCIANAESTNNPAAVNSSTGAGGLYQFLPSSWAAYGGTQFAPVAQDATVAQQTQIAEAALAQSGTAPWAGDSCVG
jgi:hypothetical protein